LHREDGPAIERPDGTKEYWINGNKIKWNVITVKMNYLKIFLETYVQMKNVTLLMEQLY
jgi:hypothetical protein